MSDTIIYPNGAATVETMTATGAQAFTIVNSYTRLDGITTEATGSRTINLTLSSELRNGAELLIETKTNGTETTVYGTSITSTTLTGVAGKTFSQKYTFNGTVFTPNGEAEQID